MTDSKANIKTLKKILSDNESTSGGTEIVFNNSLEERSYPMPENEKMRMALLDAHHILETEPDVAFDRITEMAALDFETDISLVSMVADKHQFIKSGYGVEVNRTDRDVSFCTYLVANPALGFFEVTNALEDQRFKDNALVTGFPHVRYYAGAPIIMDEATGACAGALCIIDRKARGPMNEKKRKKLQSFAAMVGDLLKTHKAQVDNANCTKRVLMLSVGHHMLNLVHMLVHGMSEIENGIGIASSPSISSSSSSSSSSAASCCSSPRTSRSSNHETTLLLKTSQVTDKFIPASPRSRSGVGSLLSAMRCSVGNILSSFNKMMESNQRNLLNSAVQMEPWMVDRVMRDAIVNVQLLMPNVSCRVMQDQYSCGPPEGEVLLDHMKVLNIIENMITVCAQASISMPNSKSTNNSGKSYTPRSVRRRSFDSETANAKVYVSLNVVPVTSMIRLTTWVSTGKFETRECGGILEMTTKLAGMFNGSFSRVEVKRPDGKFYPGVVLEFPLILLDAAGDNDSLEDVSKGASELNVDVNMNPKTRWKSFDNTPNEIKISERKNVKVLCADDELLNRKIMHRFIERCGVHQGNFTVLEDGEDIVEFLKNKNGKDMRTGSGEEREEDEKEEENKEHINEEGEQEEETCLSNMPDICFFDVVMRRMNGDEAVRLVRQAGWTCPIIATTGNVTDEQLLLKNGFDQVIFKPFTAKQIDQAIYQWVESRNELSR